MTAFIFLNKLQQLSHYLVKSDLESLNRQLLDESYGVGCWLAIPADQLPESLNQYTIRAGTLVRI